MKDKAMITLLDGAMGTMLQEKGLTPGELPEVFGYHRGDIVTSIHKRMWKVVQISFMQIRFRQIVKN